MPTGNKWYQQKIRELRKERGNKCERCPCTEDLEFAHKEHTGLNGYGRGQNHRVLDILKNPEKYMLLCKECHRKYDTEST